MVAAPNAQFYGATYLDLTTRPVFGADGLTLRFDMATWVHNPGRSWLSWTIYPAEQDAGLPFGVPLEGWLPEPLRMPADYVHIRTNQFNGKPQWEGFTPAGKMGGRWYVDWWAAGLPMNQRDRSTFELSIQPNGRVKLCAPAVGHCWVDATVDVSRLSGKTLLIVLGIHEYTPDKDVRFLTFAGASGEPTTWHLENVTLAGDSMTIPPMQSSPTVSPTVQPSPVASPTPTPSPSPEPPTFKPLADYTHDELLDEIRRRLTDG